MEMKIRDHNAQLSIEFAIPNKPGDDSRWHEVGAENDVRTKVLHKIDQWQCLRKIDGQAAFIRDPWIVTVFVPPSKKLRHDGRKLRVKRGIKLAMQEIGMI